jgi:hypothetical protein
VLIALGVVVVSGSALAAMMSGGSDNTVGVRAVQNLPSITGHHRLVKAFGIDPASARVAFDSLVGPVSIAQSADAACLLRGTDEDQCYLMANIAGGRGFSIENDCSTGSSRRMIIQGFAPPGTTHVEVSYSDGTTPLSAEVTRGAYLVIGRTPVQGEPYPTELRYEGAGGARVGAPQIPDGDHLCPPTAP